MTNTTFSLEPARLSLATLRQVWLGRAACTLSNDARNRLNTARDTVRRVLSHGEAVYGINTGFGRLAQTRIAEADLEQLQRNLVRSHAAGIGDALAENVVRLVLALKINSLAQGYSGVRLEVVDYLVELLRANAIPVIPSKGSVGASGDLAPLAHLSLSLMGEGEIRYRGQVVPAAKALQELGLEPLSFQAKEGLALLNGTQISNALALSALFELERICAATMIAGAMCVDAALGSVAPFDARIHALRPHPGQRRAATVYRKLLAGSAINQSHADCDRVQDPYCLRCQPQVMGACFDLIDNAARTLLIEANAVTDNPLLFPASGEVISGGNFHAEPVAMAADTMAIAIAEIGALAERRIAMLMDSALSTLPPFLTRKPGLNSGFMLAHVTAAALASENKSLAHPASVDSLPTSANQEDHVSMATFAARRLSAMNDNTAHIVAIELLASAQGIDLRRPLTSGASIEAAHMTIRQRVPQLLEDRAFAGDIAAIRALIDETTFIELVPEVVH